MNDLSKLILMIVTTAILLEGCGSSIGSQTVGEGDAGNSAAPRPVRFIQVAQSSVEDISFLPGEVRPRFEQRYGFRVGGKIATRAVDVGQAVKAGQTLAVLDSQDVIPAIAAQEAQLGVAQSDLKLQESELKRQQELREKGFVSGAAWERQLAATEVAHARLLAAQSQLANVRNGLEFQTLRADRAGVVVAIDAEAGSVVAAGQSVARVAQSGAMEIAVNVPERAVASMRKATDFAASIDALSGRTYKAKLRELSPAADPASRTYAARLSIVGADDALAIGMSATVRLNLGATQAIVVPNSALYTRDGTTRVWRVERPGDTVAVVSVIVGASTDGGVTVVAGLKPGDIIVTAGANLLMPGQRVRLIDAPPPQTKAEGKS